MPPKENKTPKKSSGAPPESPQTEVIARIQRGDWMQVTQQTGVLKYGKHVFRSFDEVYDFVEATARSPADQERVLHQVLSQLNRYRYLVSSTMIRFADLRDRLRLHNERFRNHLTDDEWETRWQDLNREIEVVRNEDRRIQPIYRAVCNRLGGEGGTGEAFYQQYCAKWGKTRSTLEPLRDWLRMPTGHNITEKIRLITCVVRDRCLNLGGSKGGTTDSTIPQAQDIRKCIDGEVNPRQTTLADIAKLKKSSKNKPQWGHVWLDENTGIMYDEEPQKPIPANLPILCDVQKALPSTSRHSSRAPSVGESDTSEAPGSEYAPSQAKKRKVSQSDVIGFAKVTRRVRSLSEQRSPSTPVNLGTLRLQVPVEYPEPLDRIVWDWVVQHSEYVVEHGHRPQQYPKPPEIVNASISEITGTLNRLGAGIDSLPEAIRGSTIVLLSEALLRSAELSREAREADTLRKMYEMLQFWQTRWPLNPQTANQRPVPLQVGRPFGLTATSFGELIRHEDRNGWMGHEVVRAGITVRTSGNDVFIVDNPEWEVFQRTRPFLRTNADLQALLRSQQGLPIGQRLTPLFGPGNMPRLIFFIIGRRDNHFALGWARPASREFGILDSAAHLTDEEQGNQEGREVQLWLTLAIPSVESETWSRIRVNGPQQTAADCGVYAVINAWHFIGNGRANTLGLGLGNPLELRRQIMQEILDTTRSTVNELERRGMSGQRQMAAPGNVPALLTPQTSQLSQLNLPNITSGSNPQTRQRESSVATSLGQLGLSQQPASHPSNVSPGSIHQRQRSQSSGVADSSRHTSPDPVNVTSSPSPQIQHRENAHPMLLAHYDAVGPQSKPKRTVTTAKKSNAPAKTIQQPTQPQPHTPPGQAPLGHQRQQSVDLGQAPPGHQRQQSVGPGQAPPGHQQQQPGMPGTPTKPGQQGPQNKGNTSNPAPTTPSGNPPSTPTASQSGQQIREALQPPASTNITPRRPLPPGHRPFTRSQGSHLNHPSPATRERLRRDNSGNPDEPTKKGPHTK